MFKEYFILAIRNIRTRPLRSWLTILGIIIGVFLVVSLISLSQGMMSSVSQELQTMGGDILMIFPGEASMQGMMSTMFGGISISDQQLNVIRRTRGVERVVSMAWGNGFVQSQDKGKNIFLWGMPLREGLPLVQENLGWETVDGRFPIQGKREIVLGNIVNKDLLPGVQVGDSIRIEGQRFTVSGILRSMGNRQDDSAIMMDLVDFQTATGVRDIVIAMAQVSPGFEVNQVAENVRLALENEGKKQRGQESSPFGVISSDTAVEMTGNIILILQLAIFGFASIAVIVGAIGVMNTMFTSVKERTREIGLLKAVGAKRKHISTLFLIESGLIGLIGGFIGVVGGIMVAKIGEFFLADIGSMFYIKAHLSFSLIFFSLLFSFLLGCLSGFLPARQAAKLNPVDALLYE
ncbi:MAG: ABC transporter permease [Candidatus Pacebacteria bacterium]|nr:ABC transporter permease [Candidatus Paceibacterota bacterium]